MNIVKCEYSRFKFNGLIRFYANEYHVVCLGKRVLGIESCGLEYHVGIMWFVVVCCGLSGYDGS